MTDYDIEIGFDEAPVLRCRDCETIYTRWPNNVTTTDSGSWAGRSYPERPCDECDEWTGHELVVVDLSPGEAAAKLVADRLDGIPVVDRAEAHGNVLRVWVSDSGANFSNITQDWDVRLAEMGPIEAYNSKVTEKAAESTATYMNAHVEGVRDDPKGVALPTHVHRKDGPEPRDPDNLDDETTRLCEIAGVEIPG